MVMNSKLSTTRRKGIIKANRGEKVITRKLSELQINRVLDSLNNNTLEVLSIGLNKKGVHMISYETTQSSGVSTAKSQKTIELINTLRELRKQVCENSFKLIKLDYVRAENKLIYQLELKQQG